MTPITRKVVRVTTTKEIGDTGMRWRQRGRLARKRRCGERLSAAAFSETTSSCAPALPFGVGDSEGLPPGLGPEMFKHSEDRLR
jgi:hypothetical protein